MTGNTIIHIGILDKFIPSFVDVIQKEYNNDEHHFYFAGNQDSYSINEKAYFTHLHSLRQLAEKRDELLAADKIILHGIFSKDIYWLLSENPELLPKTYWMIWGGDLYKAIEQKNNSDIETKIRNKILHNIGHCITYIHADYLLYKKEFNCNPQLHECFMYMSNIYTDIKLHKQNSPTKTILLGNAATPTNHHMESFQILEKYKEQDIRIITPLSYGDKEYGWQIAKAGKEIFGDTFVPLWDFLPIHAYKRLLNDVDIALFNHSRQQAMGNTITLLGLGKKVYIRKNTGVWDTLTNMGIQVFDVEHFNIDINESLEKNAKRVRECFSYKTYLRQLEKIFTHH